MFHVMRGKSWWANTVVSLAIVLPCRNNQHQRCQPAGRGDAERQVQIKETRHAVNNKWLTAIKFATSAFSDNTDLAFSIRWSCWWLTEPRPTLSHYRFSQWHVPLCPRPVTMGMLTLFGRMFGYCILSSVDWAPWLFLFIIVSSDLLQGLAS